MVGNMLEINSVNHGDCLELMKEIPDKSIDMILCDLPYGTTACKWDILIDFEELWGDYRRIIKNKGAIVLTASQPFTTDLINSGRDLFRYEIIWQKTQKLGFLSANKRPLKGHENICVFYKSQCTYNPQKYRSSTRSKGRVRVKTADRYEGYGKVNAENYIDDGYNYPDSIIKISNWNGALFGNTVKATKHPTQKPVALFEYLIKTYTNEGDLVLDNCIGSGTTAVACINTGRKFIGIEKDKEYFEIAQKRIKEAQAQVKFDKWF